MSLDEIDIDSFAGGGGASTGMREALGRPVTIAINHSEAAIAMHEANHPETKHYCESIWTVPPKKACGGRRVRAAWFSPDCTHFSRAKGGQPRSKEVRGLADVVIEWAREVRPRVIVLENVQEFQDWGPLDEKGYPIAERKGEDFRAWLAKLSTWYKSIEFRVLGAHRYGTPTSRARFYLVARLDGQRVVWPAATHGEGTSQPVRTAASIIDWNIPCPSIFARKKPLAEATLRRIAAGLRRYVIESASPFIVPLCHTKSGDRTHAIDRPLPVVTTAKGGEFALVTPFVKSDYGASVGRSVEAPLPTVTAGGGGHHSIVTPFVAPVRSHGGGGNDAHEVDRPLRTVTCTKRGEFAVVTPHLVTNTTRHRGRDVREPVPTITTGDHHYLASPTLITMGHGERQGQAPRVPGLDKPLGTVTAGGRHHGLVTAYLAKHYTGVYAQDLDAPLSTVTCREHLTAQHVTLAEAAYVEKFYGTARGASFNEPLPTVTSTGQHFAAVHAFMVKYYGDSDTQRQRVDRPLDVVTTKARFGLVTVHRVDYQIVDIGLRMLSPRELFSAQGFPDDYKINIEFEGKPMTKTLQIELAGNSVCPQVAAALIAANVHERWEAVA